MPYSEYTPPAPTGNPLQEVNYQQKNMMLKTGERVNNNAYALANLGNGARPAMSGNPDQLSAAYNRAVRDASNLRDLGAMVRGRQALQNGLGYAAGKTMAAAGEARVGLRQRLSEMNQNRTGLGAGIGYYNLPQSSIAGQNQPLIGSEPTLTLSSYQEY